jgi:hypothetical protein
VNTATTPTASGDIGAPTPKPFPCVVSGVCHRIRPAAVTSIAHARRTGGWPQPPGNAVRSLLLQPVSPAAAHAPARAIKPTRRIEVMHLGRMRATAKPMQQVASWSHRFKTASLSQPGRYRHAQTHRHAAGTSGGEQRLTPMMRDRIRAEVIRQYEAAH